MVESPLAELLRKRFAEINGGATRSAWGDAFGVDKATMSRLLNGILRLTRERAQEWSTVLFKDEPAAATAFTERLLAAGRATEDLRLQAMRSDSTGVASVGATTVEAVRPNGPESQVPGPLGVAEFFEDMLNNHDGVADAERMKDLLRALQSDDLCNVLICCEYRDLPRAGPDARYEYLARPVGEAVAAGVSFAMFQPFGESIPLPAEGNPNTPALNAAMYMTHIRTKCINTYNLFKVEALAALANLSDAKKPKNLRVLKRVEDRITDEEKPIKSLCNRLNGTVDDIIVCSRLRLYMRSKDMFAHLGSGFQARMFYIRYTTKSDKINHAHIIQWVSTPKKDLLVYRGPEDIDPDALKDSFYPIPHFFDSPMGRLPLKIDDSDNKGPGVRRYLKQTPAGEGLPEVKSAKSVWTTYD